MHYPKSKFPCSENKRSYREDNRHAVSSYNANKLLFASFICVAETCGMQTGPDNHVHKLHHSTHSRLFRHSATNLKHTHSGETHPFRHNKIVPLNACQRFCIFTQAKEKLSPKHCLEITS